MLPIYPRRYPRMVGVGRDKVLMCLSLTAINVLQVKDSGENSPGDGGAGGVIGPNMGTIGPRLVAVARVSISLNNWRIRQ